MRSLHRCLRAGLIVLGSLLSFPLLAQDVHFTQFYATPLLLNPALTGGFDGKVRASAIYRDQWRNVIPSPFVTTSVSLDFRFPIAWRGRNEGDAAAAGVVFMNDRVRDYDFSFNQILVSGAYHKMLDRSSNQLLSAGLQLGIGQRNINYSNLSFEDEFTIRPDGSIGYFEETREQLPVNNISYTDFNLGVNYSYAPPGKTAVFAGVAVSHINQPDISFHGFYDEEDELPDQPLYRKYTLHTAVSVPLSPVIRLQPRVLLQKQGPSAEAVTGTNLRLQFDDFSSTAFHLGAWLRGVNNVDGFALDSGVGLLGLEYKNVLLGISYDVGLSEFTAGNRGRGGLEVSLAYLGNYDNDVLSCPAF